MNPLSGKRRQPVRPNPVLRSNDTLGARRLGYWFQVNAGGARTDGLNANVSTDDNWNGIRNAAVQRTPSGWTAEITISTQSLQFGSEPNLAVAGWYARTSGDVAPGQADGYGVSIEYPNDLWYAFLKANEFGDALDPALGFLPRPGTRQYLGIALYRPRPQGGAFDRVRQFEFGGEYIQVEDLDGRPQSKELAVLPFRMTTESGYFFDPVFVADYEALDAPFPIAPGVTIPAGEYRFDRYSLRGNTPESRPWVVYADFGAGDFYTGTLKSGSVEVEWTSPDGKLQLGVSNENNFGYLAQGDFIIRLTQVEAAYSFTPDLALSTFVQHDSINDEIGINARLQWIIEPGRELFVVFNHGIEPQLADLNQTPPPAMQSSSSCAGIRTGSRQRLRRLIFRFMQKSRCRKPDLKGIPVPLITRI